MGRYRQENLWHVAELIAKVHRVDLAGMDRLADIIQSAAAFDEENDPYHSPLTSEEIRILTETTGIHPGGDVPPRNDSSIYQDPVFELLSYLTVPLVEVLGFNELDTYNADSYVEKGYVIVVPPMQVVPSMMNFTTDVNEAAVREWHNYGGYKVTPSHYSYSGYICPTYQFYPETIRLLPGIMHVNKRYPRDQWSWIDYGMFLESPQPELMMTGDDNPLTPVEWLAEKRSWKAIEDLMGNSV